MSGALPPGIQALREVLLQTELSGAVRRAALLHTDRLPPALSKPHHLRMAREALRSLAEADRAQQFELTRGRTVIVWRSRGGDEFAGARQVLSQLLSDQAGEKTVAAGELLTVYDLPDQAPWLLDELTEPGEWGTPSWGRGQRMNVAALARLESALGQVDLSRFLQRRRVVRLPAEYGSRFSSGLAAGWWSENLAWETRSFAVQDLTAALYPGLDVYADPWLFRRLMRLLDRRMFASLSASGALAGGTAMGLALNVASLLSEDFLKFDANLPQALRGHVVVFLDQADIVADPADFAFARDFALLRGYRLAIGGGTMAQLALFDFRASGLAFMQLKISTELLAWQGDLRELVPEDVQLIVGGLDRHAELSWAMRNGVAFGWGRALSR